MHIDNGVQVVTHGTRFADIDVMHPLRIAADLALCVECDTIYRVTPGWERVNDEGWVKVICTACALAWKEVTPCSNG